MIFGVTLLVFLLIILLAILVSAFFMWLGAKMAKADNATFGNSVLAAIGVSFVTFLLSWLGTFINSLNRAIGFVIGLIISIFVIKGIYKITFGRALLVWIFNVVAQVLVILIAIFFLGLIIW